MGRGVESANRELKLIGDNDGPGPIIAQPAAAVVGTSALILTWSIKIL
jgi:hypothetical protein